MLGHIHSHPEPHTACGHRLDTPARHLVKHHSECCWAVSGDSYFNWQIWVKHIDLHNIDGPYPVSSRPEGQKPDLPQQAGILLADGLGLHPPIADHPSNPSQPHWSGSCLGTPPDQRGWRDELYQQLPECSGPCAHDFTHFALKHRGCRSEPTLQCTLAYCGNIKQTGSTCRPFTSSQLHLYNP